MRHPTGIRLGPHDPSLGETLLTLQLMEDGPREVLLLVAELVVELLRAEGIRIEPRATVESRVAWWETSTEFEAFRVAGSPLPD